MNGGGWALLKRQLNLPVSDDELQGMLTPSVTPPPPTAQENYPAIEDETDPSHVMPVGGTHKDYRIETITLPDGRRAHRIIPQGA